jgi:predicted esterase
LSLVIVAADGTTRHRGVKLIVNKLPLNVDIPIQHIPEGDHVLRAEVSVAGKVLATYVAGVSVTPRLSERLDRLRIATDGRSTDSATLGSLQLLLRDLTGRTAAETNFPATRLLAEAEDLAKSVQSGDQFYGPQRTGQFWLTIPTGTSPTYTRLFVPEQAKAGKPLPLVVALHGAGGSENLFFDAYGYGLIARLAKERGWLVVAPRAGWLFDAAPPVAAFVDELAKTYPVDKQRVYLVGHSMGAMQTVALAQQSPGRFAAIAALGGGGGLSKPAVFQNLPTFIGCGKEDFLLAGAKGLAQALERSGAKRVTFKEYPNVEHMLVVQEALPEVFKFFAGAMRE